MLTKLKLERFKNFKEADLNLGPFTLLVGTNASGKSNLRDAFRFLHGIARGYSLAEIIGQKYGEGGELQWRGIRGGTREIAFRQMETFILGTSLELSLGEQTPRGNYFIETQINPAIKAPVVIGECLKLEGQEHPIFSSAPFPDRNILMQIVDVNNESAKSIKFSSHQPILARLDNPTLKIHPSETHFIRQTWLYFNSMRFFDWEMEALRRPSFPGQNVLGDRGENLSSVLYAMCEGPQHKQTLLHWLQELTPMDVHDFEFSEDPTGKISVMLVEADGQKISVYSASDGTLRFLATLAALLGPEPAGFYFFEELENGIHPTRLPLLLQLIEQQTAEGKIQVVATTHSPQLLGLVSHKTLEHASLIYRLAGQPDAHIKRILDIPEARRLIEEQDLTRLHASGWLEDAMFFLDTAEEPA